jgi:hypothetical protein
MRDDLATLLVHDSIELTGRYDPQLERELIHLRSWYGKAPLLMSRRHHYISRIPNDSLHLGWEPPNIKTDLSGAQRFRDDLLRGR